MAKRFTDSRKWHDTWFGELPRKYKFFWIYILDTCNHAGIFEVNLKLASFHLEDTYTREDVLQVFKDKLIVVSESKWFIPKFISFQYPNLNPASIIYKSLVKELLGVGLT